MRNNNNNSSAESSSTESATSSSQNYTAFSDNNNKNDTSTNEPPPLAAFGSNNTLTATTTSAETDLRDAFSSNKQNQNNDSSSGEAPLQFVSTNFEHRVSRMPGTGSPDRSNISWTDKEGVVYYYFVNPILMVCPFILVQELGERLAYFGITPTLKPFLKQTLGIGDAQASSIIGLFRGVLFLTPVVADTLNCCND